jgi:methyl-accepting chemotaxis protein
MHSHERLRRARLVSAMLGLALVAIALLIPSALSDARLWTPVFVLVGGCLLVVFLNRTGYTGSSAVLLIAMVDAAIAGFLILKPELTAGNISDFDLFILAVLIGGMVLPRGLIPFTGLVQAALIIGLFVLRPHDSSLNQLIQSDGGSAYSILAGPLVLQVVGAGIAWLQAWSVQQALQRASQAEELAEARAELSRQARLTAERNQRLEEGIAQILETHRQVAAGHLEVRAPTQKDHELWQIAHSLNTLLMRFQQYVRGEQRSGFQTRRDQTGGHRPIGQG